MPPLRNVHRGRQAERVGAVRVHRSVLVTPEARIPQALSIAARSPSSSEDASTVRHASRPSNRMQTSQATAPVRRLDHTTQAARGTRTARVAIAPRYLAIDLGVTAGSCRATTLAARGPPLRATREKPRDAPAHEGFAERRRVVAGHREAEQGGNSRSDVQVAGGRIGRFRDIGICQAVPRVPPSDSPVLRTRRSVPRSGGPARDRLGVEESVTTAPTPSSPEITRAMAETLAASGTSTRSASPL